MKTRSRKRRLITVLTGVACAAVLLFILILLLPRENVVSNTNRKEYWLPCPVCKGKTRTRVHEDTTLVNFLL